MGSALFYWFGGLLTTLAGWLPVVNAPDMPVAAFMCVPGASFVVTAVAGILSIEAGILGVMGVIWLLRRAHILG